MPLVYQQNINESAKIGVWHITESEDFFSADITPQKEISHPHKKLQHLAARYLLTVLKKDIPINHITVSSKGKPFIENYHCHFSISHCGHFAAAIVDENQNVGIDIELPNPKIISIKNKFTNDVELALFKTFKFAEFEMLTIIWSIKESMFKWYGLGELDFKKKLIIKGIDKRDNHFIADCILTKYGETKLVATINIVEGHVLTFVREKM
jgi:phosphopantetheinyl transferase